MRRTLGAPLGGTTVGGQYGLESLASMLIVPPNGAGGGGRYLPSIVVVASGEPGVPVVCWAKVEPTVRARTEVDNVSARIRPSHLYRLMFMGSAPSFAKLID